MVIQGLTIEQSIFVGAYLEAALFTEEMDEVNLSDLPEETIEKAKTDCLSFMEKADNYFGDNASIEQAGHDFWLTRNGHGAGFWDRPEKYGRAIADSLTELSKEFGEVYIYAGDDGLIYFG